MADHETGAEQWRVFVGSWDDGEPDWEHLNLLVNHSEGRRRLAAELDRFRDVSCPDCRRQGVIEAARLEKVADGAEFVGFVDGDNYLLLRADRTTLDDLQVADDV